MHGLHCFLNYSVGVDGIPPQEWWLRPKVMLTVEAVVHAHDQVQQHRMLQLHIDRGAFRG
jgi:hypothetical protein